MLIYLVNLIKQYGLWYKNQNKIKIFIIIYNG
jgi:hypothetical protein